MVHASLGREEAQFAGEELVYWQRGVAWSAALSYQKCLQAIKTRKWYSRRLVGTNEKEQNMPKMKTKSSAKKRFRVRPGGTVKRGQAFKRHILTKKSTKNKRHLRGAVSVHDTNMGSIAQMLPMAGL
jgi:large subunit ribosomal protein L35